MQLTVSLVDIQPEAVCSERKKYYPYDQMIFFFGARLYTVFQRLFNLQEVDFEKLSEVTQTDAARKPQECHRLFIDGRRLAGLLPWFGCLVVSAVLEARWAPEIYFCKVKELIKKHFLQ